MKIEDGNLTYEAAESRSGICPVCGHEGLEYGDSDTRDDSVITDWECLSCGSYGAEYDLKVFDGHIVQHIPDRTPEKRVYEDSDGNTFFVRSGIGKTYKGFCRWKEPKKGKRRESGVRGLQYVDDCNLAQYHLDAYAVKKGLKEKK